VRISYAQAGVAKLGNTLSTGKARENIIQEVVVVDCDDADDSGDSWERWEKQDAFKYSIMEKHVTKVLQESDENKVLVFVGMKRLADQLSNKLWEQGFKASAIHGGKPQYQRLSVLQQFRAGELQLLVCTDVLCRGIDIPDLSHVVIHEMGGIEEYIHRIGRTARGREGKGHALVFFEYCERDSQCAAQLIQVLETSKQPVPDGLRKIAREVADGMRRVRDPWKPSDFRVVPTPEISLLRRSLRGLLTLVRAFLVWCRRRVLV